MSGQLKIIFGDSSKNTKVYVDNKEIGLIQEIKCNINCSGTHDVQIYFPNLSGYHEEHSKVIKKMILENVQLLATCPNVSVGYLSPKINKVEDRKVYISYDEVVN